MKEDGTSVPGATVATERKYSALTVHFIFNDDLRARDFLKKRDQGIYTDMHCNCTQINQSDQRFIKTKKKVCFHCDFFGGVTVLCECSAGFQTQTGGV